MMNKKNEIEMVEVKLIDVSYDSSPLLQKIVGTINNYLLKNQGAANDFQLIRDVVERNCDSADEEISQLLPVPLYLGLMGTILGIIIGLFSLGSDVMATSFVASIGNLLWSIKFAMICSFMGLFLTTVLTTWLYREAKAKEESQKNELYSFIQTEIMPAMTENATSTIMTMQRNLKSFNNTFGRNVREFHGIMDNIKNAFDSQVRLAEDMKNMDIAEIAHVNVNVLRELRNSMSEFEKFTQYLNLMNSFVQNTATLNDSVSEQLQRTGAIENIVTTLRQNIEDNKSVMEMLMDFLAHVDADDAIKHSSATLDNTLSEALDEIRRHIQSQISEMQRYTTEATARLGQFVSIAPGQNKTRQQDITVTTDNSDVIAAIDGLSKNIQNISEKMDQNRSSNINRGILLFIIMLLLSAIFFTSVSTCSNTTKILPKENNNINSNDITSSDSDTTAVLPYDYNTTTVDTTAY